MRLLFSRSASPHHGFAAYYTFLEKIFKADAVLHFGTHGSLEFMPGKQVGGFGHAPQYVHATVLFCGSWALREHGRDTLYGTSHRVVLNQGACCCQVC
jgi:hypothetical protein